MRAAATLLTSLSSLLLAVAGATGQSPASRSAGVLIADFEQATYGPWRVEGEAFGKGPAAGTLPGQMDVEGFRGERLVNSYSGGDGATGVLTSPPLTIERKYINLLVGGGGHTGDTCVNLRVDGRTVRSAAGPNTTAGGSEQLYPVHWDVAELDGRRAVIQIVDRHTGGWGHINVDHIYASDEPAGMAAKALREQLYRREFATYAQAGYQQSHRPQFHFTSLKNWLNDPNGLVYYDGEYHLFFQHNPLGVEWGNMTWGHAVSDDLVHWRQLPHAIYPYDGGTIYSGTVAVDHNDTLGVQRGDVQTLVAAFTFARQPFYQALAYSTDRGRTFTLWNEGRAVVPNQGYDPGERDPKIFWHDESQTWVMVLWVKQGRPGRVLFFNSDDLENWHQVGHFDRDWVYECMDLVRLPVDGQQDNPKWLLYDASFDYEIGDFDGQRFTSDRATHQGDHGPNFYAAQSFNNSPAGRTVMIGWMRGGDEVPFVRAEMPFNMQMSFPTSIRLKTTDRGIRLVRWPVEEIEQLYDDSIELQAVDLPTAQARLAEFDAELIDCSIAFAATEETRVTIDLRGQQVRYADGEFTYEGSRLPAPPRDGTVSLRALVDRTSLELFANGGQSVATHYASFDRENRRVSVTAGGDVSIESLDVHKLRSAWAE